MMKRYQPDLEGTHWALGLLYRWICYDEHGLWSVADVVLHEGEGGLNSEGHLECCSTALDKAERGTVSPYHLCVEVVVRKRTWTITELV